MLRKLLNPYVGMPGYNCIGCCPTNPIGLHLQFWEDGDDIVTEWSPSDNYQSWIDTLHGGIISTLVDELAGWVVFRKLQTAGMTTSLHVKFHKPVMTTEPKVTLRARITEQKRSFVVIHVTLCNSKGELCDEAEATYYAFGKERAGAMNFTTCKAEGEE